MNFRRPATKVDPERWNAVLAKVAEARRALNDADVLLGQVIPTLDGDDLRSHEVVATLNKGLDAARMAAGNVQHPVEEHWAGGSLKDDVPNSLHWRY